MTPTTNLTAPSRQITPGSNIFPPGFKPSVKRGAVSVNAEIQNLSLILYRIPVERVASLVPDPLTIETTRLKGGSFAWLSVVSYLDLGSRRDGHPPFERTDYRLHVMRHGQSGHWLLGISLGSLSGVGARHLWPMPWHLSAMEFQVAYDKSAGRFSGYRLQTQSQWANSTWEIIDRGQSLYPDRDWRKGLPASFASNTVNNYFPRRDGAVGLYQAHYGNPALTSAKLKFAQSDLIERLGLLTGAEMQQPEWVALQHQANYQIFSPLILDQSSPLGPLGMRREPLANAS